MSEEVIVRYSSPTLAGIKSGSLFSQKYEDKDTLISEIRNLNKSLSNKGVIVLPLRFMNNTATIFIYRPSLLKECMNDTLAQKILLNCGYDYKDFNSQGRSISRLAARIKGNQFPHEIGIFLGYPPKDVEGFIDNNAANYKMSGLWKVYDDVNNASRLMNSYRKCTDNYLKRFNSGYQLDTLTVKI